MRKRKISVVLLLVLLVVMTSVFVACNPTGNANIPEPTPIPKPDPSDPIIGDGKTIDSKVAWNMLKDAAFAAATQESDSRYINVDTSFVLGYEKDGSDSVIVLRLAIAMNLTEQSQRTGGIDDQFLIELRSFGKSEIKDAGDSGAVNTLVKNGGGELLAGFYFYEGKLVADVRGIKNAAGERGESVHVVWTENLDMAGFAKKVHGALKEIGITDLMFNKLLGYNIGSLIDSLIKIDLDLINMSVEDIIVTVLFGGSLGVLKDNGNGSQTILLPCDLSFVAGLIPLLQGLISEDIIGLVNKVLGLDLGKLGALTGMALYLKADIQDGVLETVNTSIDINLNSNASAAVEERYGEFQNSIGIDLGYMDTQFVGKPTLDVAGMLKARVYDEKQNISFYDHIQASTNKYSLLTFEADLTLTLDTANKTVTISNVLDAFGSLFNNILEKNLDGKMYETLMALFTEKTLSFEETKNSIAIKIRADINTKNTASTRMAIELTGSNQTRLGIYYTGLDKAVFIDASGMLGNRNTKLKVENIDIVEIVDGLMDQLLDTIMNAINGNANTEAQYEQLAAEGGIIKQHTGIAAAEDESNEIGDTMGLIMAIIDNITVGMDGNIFNINSIHFEMTQNILDYIFGLIFVGDLEGGTVPITNASLEYRNIGFGEQKSLSITAGLGASKNNPLVKLGVGLGIKFGSLSDPTSFNDLFGALEKEKKNYLPITKDGELNTDILHVSIQTDLNIDLEALSGTLAQLNIDLKDLAIGNSVKGVMFDILFKLGSIRGGLKANIEADIDLTGGLNSDSLLGSVAKILLNSTAKIVITSDEKVEATGEYKELLSIYLQDGKLYIDASVLCLSLDHVMIDLTELLGMMGVEIEDGSSEEEAFVADEATDDPVDTSSTESIIALIGGMIQGINFGKNSIEIALATNLVQSLLDGLNLDGVDISFDAQLAGGIKIELSNGLDLSQLRLGLYVSIGENVNLEIGLKGLELGLDDANTKFLELDNKNADDYVDLLANPYLSLDMVLGIDVSVEQGTTHIEFGNKATHYLSNDQYLPITPDTDLSGYQGILYYKETRVDPETGKTEEIYLPAYSDTLSVGFEEAGKFSYKLRVGGRLDLASVMAYLLGEEEVDTKNRRSELLIELTGKKEFQSIESAEGSNRACRLSCG